MLKTTSSIPGYDAKTQFYTAHDGRPVTYEMCYTDGECVSQVVGDVRGYHCWHRGVDGEGDAFCCRCNAGRPALTNEPSH